MMELFPYQIEGSKFLSERRRALLFDAPGLGKTIQAVSAANAVGAGYVETVCPASVRSQWSHNLQTHLNPGAWHGACSYNHARDHGLPNEMNVLVLDELHYLKNTTSGRTQKMFGSLPFGQDGAIYPAEYIWGMTGTPSPTDPTDLYAPMLAIVPGSLTTRDGKTMDFWQFARKFCVMRDTGYGMKAVASKNLDELRDRLAPYMLRRTKKDVLDDWKEPMVGELWLDAGVAGDMLHKAELEPEARAVAEAFREGGFDALQQLAKVDQAGVARYRRYVGILKILPVVKWLAEQFESGMEKIIVIAIHREVLAGIAEKLLEEGITSVIYQGGMTEKQKDEAKNRFIKSEKKCVFLGQLIASGTGLDGLQHATGRMLFVEWSWLADDNYQALCRLDRIGQSEPVLGEFAAFERSLDGAIMKSAARRAKENKQLFG